MLNKGNFKIFSSSAWLPIPIVIGIEWYILIISIFSSILLISGSPLNSTISPTNDLITLKISQNVNETDLLNENDIFYKTIKKTESNFSRSSLEALTARIRGLEIGGSASKEVEWEDGIVSILSGYWTEIRFFGDGFTNYTIFRFVYEPGVRGSDCDDVKSTKIFNLNPNEKVNEHSVVIDVKLPPMANRSEVFYICSKESNLEMPWVHQGTNKWITLKTYEEAVPVFVKIILLCIFLILSGLLSGLNLGLMALDPTQLKIILSTGTKQEKAHAKVIYPIRSKGNYLLCSLLLGNVMVNASLTAILDEFFSGVVAVIGATLSIVVLGEIAPQAFCSRYGLAVGAKTVWVTRLLMVLTFPVSYPVSLLLDKILGEEIGSVYNREKLKELIKITKGYHDLEIEEENIISGALELRNKKVTDVMTTIQDVFMVPIEAVLDFETLSAILDEGYSRIPVYSGHRANVVSLLYTKDLAFVDPDLRMGLKTICEFFDNPINLVYENVTLDVIFKEFRNGEKGHLAFVRKIVTSDEKDPNTEIIGVVTLEDIIEALIKSEINDETDYWCNDDNVSRKKSRSLLSYGDNPNPNKDWKNDGITISPQLNFAAFQFLSTSVEPFKEENISKSILQKLLNQDIVFQVKLKSSIHLDVDPDDCKNNLHIYEKGKRAEYFVLILEGKVRASMGKEDLIFEGGPFTYFGTQSLALDDGPSTPVPLRKFANKVRSQSVQLDSVPFSAFVPDYSVTAITDVVFIKITRSIYLAARQAAVLEKAYQGGDEFYSENNFEKLMRIASNDSKFTVNKVPEFGNKDTNLSEILLDPKSLTSSKPEDEKPSNSITSNKPQNEMVARIKASVIRRNSSPSNS